MEEQIASLACLVHHALSLGPDIPGVKDTVRSVTCYPLSQQSKSHIAAEIQVNTICSLDSSTIWVSNSGI